MAALAIPIKSNPLCFSNRWSSVEIRAFFMFGEMLLIDTKEPF